MSDKIEVNRRRVLGGLVTIGAAGAAVGAGTFAAFSDTETSTQNSFTAGTLNLELTGGTNGVTTITASKIAPGDLGYLAISLENVGSLNGVISALNIGDTSGGSFSPTLRTDTDGTDAEFETNPSDDQGEIDDNLEVEVLIETSGDFNGSLGSTTGEEYSPSGNETHIVSDGTLLKNAIGTNEPNVTLNQGSSEVLVINWNLPSGTGNVAQGDSASFDIQAVLESA